MDMDAKGLAVAGNEVGIPEDIGADANDDVLTGKLPGADPA